MSIRDLNDRLDEFADLIVEGRSREAYTILRDTLPWLPNFDVRKRLIESRAVDTGPRLTPETIAASDAAHDRALGIVRPNARITSSRHLRVVAE